MADCPNKLGVYVLGSTISTDMSLFYINQPGFFYKKFFRHFKRLSIWGWVIIIILAVKNLETRHHASVVCKKSHRQRRKLNK